MTNQEEIQNAIEWIEGLRDGLNDKDNIKYCNMAIKAIKALEPPLNDNWDGYSSRLWKNAYERGKADAEQRWIPVSERLPGFNQTVILTNDGVEHLKKHGEGFGIRYTTFGYLTIDGWERCDPDDDCQMEEITAWMPLPEPYKAEKRTEERTKTHACDCISRQAAIDAFEKFIHELGIKDEPYNYGEMALSVQNVPSVEPERNPGKWIDGKCNRCGTHAPFWEMATTYYCSDYCPKCGAKMEVHDESMGSK